MAPCDATLNRHLPMVALQSGGAVCDGVWWGVVWSGYGRDGLKLTLISSGTIMVLDAQAQAWGRLWCLQEVYHASGTKRLKP